MTSDVGLLWRPEADAVLRLTDAIAAVIPDWRPRRGQHDLPTLQTLSIYQIACGYEDQNDADTLRRDPLRREIYGRRPATGTELASQSTFSGWRMLDGSISGSMAAVAGAIFAPAFLALLRYGALARILHLR